MENLSNFDAEKAEMEVCVAAFKRLVVGLTDSVAEASDFDKRRELEKLESNYSSLKTCSGIDNTQDITELSESFVTDVESPFAVFQKEISQLKESSPPTSKGSSDSEADSEVELLNIS